MDAAALARLAALVDAPSVRRLFSALGRAGAELRLVGGAVRNALIGLPPGDIDCATTAPPDETMRLARSAGFKAVPTGYEHGTITVIVDGTPFEVTTLREDVETDGRRAVVRFGKDFRRDAERRDFTFNALSVDAGGHLHDYTGGVADLARRRVRFIGDPDQRIREDYLRILRFFRFHAEYGLGAPDGPALDAAIRHRAGLDTLSRERIRHEMAKLLMAPRAAEVAGDMADASLLDRLLAGLGERGRLARIGAAPPPGAGWAARLAALAVLSADDVPRLRERFKLSNDETAQLAAYGAAMTSLKGHCGVLAPRDIRIAAYRHGVPALALAAAALVGEPRPRLDREAEACLADLAAGRAVLPAAPFDGAMARAHGVMPGPHMGAVLRRAETLWLEADMPDDAETWAALLNQAVSEA